MRIPTSLNQERDKGLWASEIQHHFTQIYTAPKHKREELWRTISRIHIQAFRNHTPLPCLPEDIRALIKDLKPCKAAGPDGLHSQIKSHFGQIRFLSREFEAMANDPAYQPHHRPVSWNNALVVLLAKKSSANTLNDFRPISLISHIQKFYTMAFSPHHPPSLHPSSPHPTRFPTTQTMRRSAPHTLQTPRRTPRMGSQVHCYQN